MLHLRGASNVQLFASDSWGDSFAHSIKISKSDNFFPLFTGEHRYGTEMLGFIDQNDSAGVFRFNQLTSKHWSQFI